MTASQEINGIEWVNTTTFFQDSLGAQKISVFHTIPLFAFTANDIKLPSF